MLDLDDELGRLAEHPLVSPPPVAVIRDRALRRRRRHRVTAVVGALTIAVGIASGALVLRVQSSPQVTVGTRPHDALAALPPGWHQLGTIPEGVITPDSAVWTGKEVVMWDAASGVRFSPSTGQWRPLPRSPLSGRALVTMAWTGREVLVWGGTRGFTDTTGATPDTDGAAYNPRTDTWRRIPDAPIKPRLALGGVWTGHEFIVAGGPPDTVGRAHTSAEALTDGAAYNPRTNTWRRIPSAPIRVTQGVVAWTGSQMLVYGSFRSDFLDPRGTISNTHAALYDPATNRWRALPSPGLNGTDPTAAVTDHHVVAVSGYATTPRTLNLGAPAWRSTARLDATPSEACSATLAGGPTTALLSNCGEFWSFDPATSRWSRRPSPPVPFEQQPWGQPIWTGHAFLFWDTNPWSPGPTPTSDASRKDLEVWAFVP